MHYIFKKDKKKLDINVAKQAYKKLCDIFEMGHYPLIEIIRPENYYKPKISGEFALPEYFESYLIHKFTTLIEEENMIFISPGQIRLKHNNPQFIRACEEITGEASKQRLFLFSPERIEISCERLKHYTHTNPKDFQHNIILTNYKMHLEIFKKMYPKATGSKDECQMETIHAKKKDKTGITMINIGVGPANAKTITDQIGVLRPNTLIMIGHCGGLKGRQKIGDFLLADKFIRDDHVMDSVLNKTIPITPTLIINTLLLKELEKKKAIFRIGTVFTTNNRDWEYKISYYEKKFNEGRCYGIDMESAVIAAQGYRYKIPNATLLMVSDKPLHGKPKLSQSAQEFYAKSKHRHVEMAINTINSANNLSSKFLAISGIKYFSGSQNE